MEKKTNKNEANHRNGLICLISGGIVILFFLITFTQTINIGVEVTSESNGAFPQEKYSSRVARDNNLANESDESPPMKIPMIDDIYKPTGNNTPAEEIEGGGGIEGLGRISDDNTVVYYSFDNPDNVENDDSGNGLDLTISGAKQSGNSIYGRTLDFDGDNDYAYIGSDSSLDLEGILTIDTWVFWNGPGGGGSYDTIVAQSEHFWLYVGRTGASENIIYFSSGDPWESLGSNTELPRNEWTRISVVRTPATGNDAHVAIFINGALDNEGDIDKPLSKPARQTYVGAWTSSGQYSHNFNGYIDELSISDTNRQIGDTVAFLNLNEGVGDKVRDRSPQNIPYGTVNGASWTTGRFGNALDFDGINDYISLPANDSLHLTGKTSIEVWVNYSGPGTGTGSVDTIIAEEGHFWIFVRRTGPARVWFEAGNNPWSPDVYSNSALQIGVWTHIAVVRTNSTHADIYINGVLDTYTDGITYAPNGTSANPLYIGSWGGSDHHFNGSIDEVRISNYEKTFSANNCYGGDVLELPFEGASLGQYWDGRENGGILDDKSPLDNDMSRKCGNMQHSNNGKYGQCISLDGAGDYLEMFAPVPSSLNPPTITVEAWINHTQKKLAAIVDNSYGAGVHEKGGYVLRLREDGTVEFFVYDDNQLRVSVRGTTELDTNKWYHVAGVSDGYNVRIYINGVCEDMTTYEDDIHYGQDVGLFIGAGYYGDKQFFNGLIDSVRISNFARTFREDMDGDGMSDLYEIMRSNFSDQYNPLEHNGRYGLMVAPVRDNDEIQYKYDITQMHHYLKSIGWNDNDIIFLTVDNLRGGSLNLGENYNGDWIDGEAFHDNLDGSAQHDTAFDALQNGGDYELQQSDGTWSSFFLSSPTEKDNILIYLRDHGGYQNSNYVYCTYAYNDYGFTYNDCWTASNMDTELDSINSKYMVCTLLFCASGGFMDSLDDETDRIIVTCQDTRSSNRYQYLYYSYISGKLIGEFVIEGVPHDETETDNGNKDGDSVNGHIRWDTTYDINGDGDYDDQDEEKDYEDTNDNYELDENDVQVSADNDRRNEGVFDRLAPFKGNDEISNADGISSVNNSRERVTNNDYKDVFISVQEAHYMGDIVVYDRWGNMQTPLIYQGTDIAEQIYL